MDQASIIIINNRQLGQLGRKVNKQQGSATLLVLVLFSQPVTQVTRGSRNIPKEKLS